MAKEIWHNYTSGATLYACRFNLTGEVFLSDGSAAEVWGASGHDADDYDVPLTERGASGHYSGDFDASSNIDDGTYRVVAYLQAGANPADGDTAVAQGQIHWHESAGLTLRTALVLILAAIAAVSALIALLPSKEDIRGEIDANSTQIALIVEDTNELQTDWTDDGRLDVILDAIKKYTDLIVIVATDVNDANDAGTFTVSDGNNVADFYNNHLIAVQDANDSYWELRIIEDWATNLEVTVDTDFAFTPAEDDLVYIMGWQYLGNVWEKIQNLGMVTNVINKTSTGVQRGAGTTLFDTTGDDPH